jgi:hypothetical protein
MFLHENIQYVTVLINGPPEIMMFAIDGDKPWLGTSRWGNGAGSTNGTGCNSAIPVAA